MGNTSTTSGSNPSSDTRKVAEPISSTSATGRETGASATRLAASKPTLPKHTTAPIVQHSQPMALCGRRDRINAPTVTNARNGSAPVHQSTIATTAACRPLSRASVKATADPPATSSHRPQASLDAERRRGRSWLGDLMPPGCEGSAVVWSMCCSSGSSPVLWSFPHDRPENVTGNDTVTTMASEQRRASKGTVPPRGVLTGSSGFRPPLRPRLAAHLGFVLDGFHANRAHPLPQPWLSPRQVCRAMLTSAATPVPERSAAGVVELGAQRRSLGEEVGAVPLGGGTALECLVEPALSLRA